MRQLALLLLLAWSVPYSCLADTYADGESGSRPATAMQDDGYYSSRQEPSYNQEYENSYAAKDDCPNPQSADWVDNAYLKHYTFEWAKLAAEVAPYWAANPPRQQPDAQRAAEDEPEHPRDGPHNVPMPRSRRRANILQETADAAVVRIQGSPERGAAAAAEVDNSTKAHIAADAQGDAQAHLAYVKSTKFLARTGSSESGQGFQGTSDTPIPTDEALAVGPHPMDPDHVLVVHGINRAWEIFAATRDGQKRPSEIYTKIGAWQIMQRMGYPEAGRNSANITSLNPNAFYDKKDDRYVISWSSTFYNPVPRLAEGSPAPFFICASADNNPLGTWTCWALLSSVESQPFAPFCAGRPVWDYYAADPQMSYSEDGVYVSVGGFCLETKNGVDETLGFLSALWAFPKKVLYTTPATEAAVAVFRAMYLPGSSWYRSLSIKDQLLPFNPVTDPEGTSFVPFNTWVLPSRPTSIEDVSDPVFVMGKPYGGLQYMSFAKLTGEPLHKMTSRETAPKIYATVVSSSVSTNNDPRFGDGQPVIPQPGPATTPSLYAGDVGLSNGVQRTYGASHHHGRVYVATSEYYGAGNDRVPSIYWAFVDPSKDLCKPILDDWGILASEQGLALAFPVIVPRDCGAFLAYAYGGNTSVRLDGVTHPAYAGVASSVVGCEHEVTRIDVVKRGEGVVNKRPRQSVQPWGNYSAFQVCDNRAWFAVPFAVGPTVSNSAQYGSWVGVSGL